MYKISRQNIDLEVILVQQLKGEVVIYRLQRLLKLPIEDKQSI